MGAVSRNFAIWGIFLGHHLGNFFGGWLSIDIFITHAHATPSPPTHPNTKTNVRLKHPLAMPGAGPAGLERAGGPVVLPVVSSVPAPLSSCRSCRRRWSCRRWSCRRRRSVRRREIIFMHVAFFPCRLCTESLRLKRQERERSQCCRRDHREGSAVEARRCNADHYHAPCLPDYSHKGNRFQTPYYHSPSPGRRQQNKCYRLQPLTS